MDKELIRNRFYKSLPTYDANAVVQSHIAHRLADLIVSYSRVPVDHCLEIGCGTGLLTRALAARLQVNRFTLNDICDRVQEYYDSLRSTSTLEFMIGDAECMNFSNAQYQLIASASALQWFEHPIRFIRRCMSSLVPQGLIAVSTFGPDNMREVTRFTGVTLPYPDLDTLRAELSRDFDLIHLDHECIELKFDAPMEVLWHLKNTGVTGIRDYSWTKSRLAEFSHYYTQHYRLGNGQVKLTYHPLYLIIKPKL